jgi:hypothetical protein
MDSPLTKLKLLILIFLLYCKINNMNDVTVQFCTQKSSSNSHVEIKNRENVLKMDIRKFFKAKESDNSDTEPPKKLLKAENVEEPVFKHEDDSEIAKNDIGRYLNRCETVSNDLKRELLQHVYVPEDEYDFKRDATNKARPFKKSWISQYAPWLAYSALLKGALCIFCVLFPQPIRRGFQGAFIASALTKFKDFHEDAKIHARSEWHRGSTQAASVFLAVSKDPTKDIVSIMDSSIRKSIEEIRKKLKSILSSIIYCSTHDLAL